MSAPAASNPIGRRFGKRWLLAALVPLGASAFLGAWFAGLRLDSSDPLFRGRPESEWIRHLKYWDDQQVKEWRAYGAEGVSVLVRGLERANHPGERAWRRIYRRLPGFLAHWLPAAQPDSTRSSRMCMAALLSSLGPDAKSALPAMIWLLNRDEDAGVREIAIGYFTSTEDEHCLLNQMSPQDRQRILPALVRDLQNPQEWGVRNNAANALRWFPEHREIVAPVLTQAIHDPKADVALLAAVALHRVAPDRGTNAATVTVVAAILRDPDTIVACRAAELLGQLRAEPAIAVPALIAGMAGTNQLVAIDSASALLKFDQPADLILPALEAAVQRGDLPAYLKAQIRQKMDSLSPLATNRN